MRFSILTQQARSLTRAARVVEQQFLDGLAHRRALQHERLDAQAHARTTQMTQEQADAKARLRTALGYSE